MTSGSGKKSEKSKRAGKLLSGSEVLFRILEADKNPLSDQFLRWKLWGNWQEIVGETIAKHSSPVGYVNGTLYVWVNNSSWMHHLLFVRQNMMEAINKKLARRFVHKIQFTLDRRCVPGSNDEELKQTIDKLVPDSED